MSDSLLSSYPIHYYRLHLIHSFHCLHLRLLIVLEILTCFEYSYLWVAMKSSEQGFIVIHGMQVQSYLSLALEKVEILLTVEEVLCHLLDSLCMGSWKLMWR